MKLVEYWRWFYWDPETGRFERTETHLTSEEAEQRHPGAQRIAGSLTLREVDGVTFAETVPSVFAVQQT